MKRRNPELEGALALTEELEGDAQQLLNDNKRPRTFVVRPPFPLLHLGKRESL